MTTAHHASDDALQRLNKFLAFHLGVSRRQADQLIAQGRVTVNGSRTTLGSRLTAHATVCIDNQPLQQKTAFSYLLLHKPRGYVCSRKQQGGTPTIYSLLPNTLHHLKSVGRLDSDSSGLLLLSDDGDFTYHMTHPKFHKTKTYLVQLDTPLQPLHQQMISDFGVQLEDGPSQFTITKPSVTPDYRDFDDSQVYHITMHEGRNRQIRRTFAALGYTVRRLHRTSFGRYHLDQLPPGRYRSFTP